MRYIYATKSTPGRRGLFVIPAVVAGLISLGSEIRAETTVELNQPLEIKANTEHTEPDVHTIQVTPSTITIKEDSVTTSELPIEIIVDYGTIDKNWREEFNLEGINFYPEQEPIVVCQGGLDYLPSGNKVTVNLTDLKEKK